MGQTAGTAAGGVQDNPGREGIPRKLQQASCFDWIIARVRTRAANQDQIKKNEHRLPTSALRRKTKDRGCCTRQAEIRQACRT